MSISQEVFYEINAASASCIKENMILNWCIGGYITDDFANDQVSFLDVFLYDEFIEYQFDIVNDHRYHLFPNPVLSVLHLLTFKDIENAIEMKCFNINGALIYEQEIKSKYETFNLSSLTSGVYFVMLNDGMNPEVFKIIKD